MQDNGPHPFKAENRASLVSCILHVHPELAPKKEEIYRTYMTEDVSKAFLLYKKKPNDLLLIAECVALRVNDGTHLETVMRIARAFRNRHVQRALFEVEGLIPESRCIVDGVAKTASSWSPASEIVLRTNSRKWLKLLRDPLGCLDSE